GHGQKVHVAQSRVDRQAEKPIRNRRPSVGRGQRDAPEALFQKNWSPCQENILPDATQPRYTPPRLWRLRYLAQERGTPRPVAFVRERGVKRCFPDGI